ncbi:MAG: 2-C-methyl-D-erythritol 4-phosphate cytidylyltransferase [Deltaproteobacteria bacterium]|nr:2-C-methyl-D-erythritol 4-phosphate cytidylyltransferase [Deltaproteobacteria bacterium]
MEKRGEGRKSGSAAAVIPAAGAGVRMGAERPKQFLLLDGKPILTVTLEAFERCPVIDSVVLVVPGDVVPACEREIVQRHGLTKVRRVVPGGARRQDSVRLGVEACPVGCDLVVVHDGVRPLVRSDLIERTVAAARDCGAAIAALPARDTVKQVRDGTWVERTLDRRSLWLVQTPQAFLRADLLEVHRRAVNEGWEEMPDDASLLERAGLSVRVVDGAEDNIKVTTPNDLEVARFLLANRKGGGPPGGDRASGDERRI